MCGAQREEWGPAQAVCAQGRGRDGLLAQRSGVSRLTATVRGPLQGIKEYKPL